jgi:hypothetical protein
LFHAGLRLIWRQLFHVEQFLRIRIYRLQGALQAFAANGGCSGFFFKISSRVIPDAPQYEVLLRRSGTYGAKSHPSRE